MTANPLAVAVRLHRDQQGTISILSVFAVLLLVMLLGMVMNVGRHVDGKIRMQNAADAAAYSGGVVMARGMNTLAFTNHLLCDVFAITAFLREARDANAQSYAPAILAAWSKVGPAFSASGIPKFQALGTAIAQKTPREQELVRAYGDWAAAASRQILPLMEEILSDELIPKYQRAVVEAFPDIAQQAAMQTALCDGQPDHGRGNMLGALWRTDGQLVGLDDETTQRTLPVVDPVGDAGVDQADYIVAARRQREELAHKYLRDWNNEALAMFDREAKMCQFASLWRSFTCGQLKKLLDKEYPRSNLPHMILRPPSDAADRQAYLQKYCTFVSVVYWRKLPEMGPKLFHNPIESDAQAYAEVHLFIPRARLEWQWISPGGAQTGDIALGGVPGELANLPGDAPAGPPAPTGVGRWVVGRQGVPTQWDLLNQSWACQLAPATQPALVEILQTTPPLPAFQGGDLTMPNLGSLTGDDIGKISTH
jgi:hypothetical protein